MQKDLADKIRFKVDVLDFVWSDVLALLQLENVLFSVNNLESSALIHNLNHISSLKPSLGIYRFLSYVWQLVIAFAYLWSSNPEFPSWQWFPCYLIFIVY